MATILLVDDDAAVLSLTKWILESDGYCVYSAENAGDAIMIAQELNGGFNLLLTDMVMPVTGGDDLILAIRRTFPNVRTMAMSGAPAPGDFQQRDYPILAKPFTREQLLAAVKKVLNPQGGGS
jgi:two-component system cell cycle sensor histidine kinase/response regulator CckA